jgi:hypothetical protein
MTDRWPTAIFSRNLSRPPFTGGVCVPEGREMSDGIRREEAAEFGELGSVGHCGGIREGGIEGRSQGSEVE